MTPKGDQKNQGIFVVPFNISIQILLHATQDASKLANNRLTEWRSGYGDMGESIFESC